MDYVGYEELFSPNIRSNYKLKKWTTAEIYKEVMFVIDQLEEIADNKE